jgi:amyloid beta precursor protein binding protein 1
MDLGNNFFLEQSSIGKSKSEEIIKYLLEMNQDVHGYALNLHPK